MKKLSMDELCRISVEEFKESDKLPLVVVQQVVSVILRSTMVTRSRMRILITILNFVQLLVAGRVRNMMKIYISWLTKSGLQLQVQPQILSSLRQYMLFQRFRSSLIMQLLV